MLNDANPFGSITILPRQASNASADYLGNANKFPKAASAFVLNQSVQVQTLAQQGAGVVYGRFQPDQLFGFSPSLFTWIANSRVTGFSNPNRVTRQTFSETLPWEEAADEESSLARGNFFQNRQPDYASSARQYNLHRESLDVLL